MRAAVVGGWARGRPVMPSQRERALTEVGLELVLWMTCSSNRTEGDRRQPYAPGL